MARLPAIFKAKHEGRLFRFEKRYSPRLARVVSMFRF